MTAPTALFFELRRRGIKLQAHGGRILFRPVDRMTPELRDQLRENKPALLAMLCSIQPDKPEPETVAEPTVAARVPSCRWIDGPDLDRLPEHLQGLVCSRDGWMPERWASYLRDRAGRCDDQHGDTAERYEQAARLLSRSRTTGVLDLPRYRFCDTLLGRMIELSEQLREAIRRSGFNRKQVADRTGISYSVIHGFMSGERGITLDTASKVAEVVGVELRAIRRRRK